MKTLVLGTAIAMAGAFGSTGHAQDAQAPGYMIANYTIKDQAAYQKYMEEAGPLAPKFGGKIIVFNLNAIAVEGKPQSVMAIAEFRALRTPNGSTTRRNTPPQGSFASLRPKVRW